MKLYTSDNLYNNEITSSAFSLNRRDGFFSHLFIFSLFLHVLGLGQQKAQYPLQEAITQPFSPISSPHHYLQQLTFRKYLPRVKPSELNSVAPGSMCWSNNTVCQVFQYLSYHCVIYDHNLALLNYIFTAPYASITAINNKYLTIIKARSWKTQKLE